MLPVHSRKPLRVAIFNDGHDTLALLRNWLGSHGHLSLTAKLQEMRTADTEAGEFIRRNAADVVVFDVGLPYMCNWDFGAALQLLPGAEGIPFVMTTANKAALETLVGPTDAYELIGTPANLEGLLGRIYKAVGWPGRSA
jgi:CheY-like chemotaxis protein